MGSRNQTTYIQAIEDCCSRYPDLHKLREFLKDQKPDCRLSRAAVLEFGSGRSSRVRKIDFKDVNDMKIYLSDTVESPCKHRLYLLEDLSEPFVEAFGAHFWIDPFLFAAHENSTHWTASRHYYTLPRRLSPSVNGDPLFTLRYYEVVKGPESVNRSVGLKTVSKVHRKAGARDRIKDKKTLSHVHRRIEAGDHFFEENDDSERSVFVIRRNASFWSRKRKGGSAGTDAGWDALILVDPPVGDSILDGKDRIHYWPNVLYGLGYVDFTPWSVNNPNLRLDDVGHGPPRTSTFDDIIWYWSRVASEEQIQNAKGNMAISATFAKKIVVSNWNVMLEYVWAKLSDYERALGSPGITGIGSQEEPLDQLANILAAVSLFRRRLTWYSDEVELSLRSLGVDMYKDSDDEGRELLSVLKRLQGFKEKVESLTSVVTGMLSVRQADVSLQQAEASLKQANASQQEAKLVSRLTFVALIFIPLSFTASIFSMGGDFLPGSSHFWVYFAAALPITAIVLALAWLARGRTWI